MAASVGAACSAVAGTMRPVGPMLNGIHLTPDREEMVAVPGGRIYVRIDGKLDGPRPPIVFLHGGPGSSHWYFLNATAMADERAVILYDQLDSGRSDRPGDPANWRIARFVEELAAIRDHLRIERWHVVGASWGGTIALEYGATRPKELASLVLQSPLISTALWLEDARALKDAMPADVRDLLNQCASAGALDEPACEAAIEAFYQRHVHLSDPPAAIAAYKAALPVSFSENIYNHMWGRAEFTASGTLSTYDGRPLLKQIEGPRTLFLAGEHDEARPATVAALAREATGARFAEVIGAAHSAMNDAPEAYLAVLRPWLAGHDR